MDHWPGQFETLRNGSTPPVTIRDRALKIAVFRKQIVSILPEIDIAQRFDVAIGKGDIATQIVATSRLLLRIPQ